MPKRNLKGILPALSTVCGKRGEIDERGQRSLVSFNIEKGVHGLIPLVMNGDFYKFSEAERKEITDIVVDEVNGRVPVFVGTSHTGTRQAIELSKYAQDAGADGVVIIPPYFNEKETRVGLFNHYAAVARAIDIPIMIQEVEETTGVPVPTAMISRLHEQNDNVRYLKTEGFMATSKIAEVKAATNGKVGIFGGYFGFGLVDELDSGALGTVPGCSIPELCQRAYKEYNNGRKERARAELGKYTPFLEFNLLNVLSFPQVDIEILRMRGVIESAFMREPRVPLTESSLKKLRTIANRLGLSNRR